MAGRRVPLAPRCPVHSCAALHLSDALISMPHPHLIGPGALALVLLAACLPARVRGVSWRLFAGREECLTEYMPDYQWSMTKAKDQAATSTQVLIDIGVVVSSRYGSESNKAAVDLTIYNPAGQSIHSEEGLSETELAVTGEGTQGPWRACFRVSRGQILRPSVVVKVTYFTVNQMTLVGTSFEWDRDDKGHSGLDKIDPSMLGSAEQVLELQSGLQRLDHLLLNVTHEQRYLYARTVRHLRTVESTHSRALWYQLAIYSFIVVTSFAQAVGVRLMFRRNRRAHGLLI